MSKLICSNCNLITLVFVFSTSLQKQFVNGIIPDTTFYKSIRVGQYNQFNSAQLWEFNVKPMTSYVLSQYAISKSDKECPDKDITIYIQHGGYPVFSINNQTFPGGFYLNRTNLYKLTAKTSNNGTLAQVSIRYPNTGQWFGAAYVEESTQQVISRLQGKNCHYRMQFNISTLAMSTSEWTDLSTTRHTPVTTKDGNTQRYRFYIDDTIYLYDIKIKNCVMGGKNLTHCPVNISAQSNRIPDLRDPSVYKADCTQYPVCTLVMHSPMVNAWQYIILHTNGSEDLKFSISVSLKSCQESSDIFSRYADPHDSDPGSSLHFHPQYTAQKCVLTSLPRVEDSNNQFVVTYISHSFSEESIFQVTDNTIQTVKFDVLPQKDVGGTLKVSAAIQTDMMNDTSQTTVVTLCITHNHIPVNATSTSCADIDTVNLNSTSEMTSQILRFFPYPEPGVWYISMSRQCFSCVNNSAAPEPCADEFTYLELSVTTDMCVEGMCGETGSCSAYVKGSFSYSVCICDVGYHGYMCTDDSKAESNWRQMTYTLLLTLSNLFFIPAIVLAIYRHFYVEALVYFANMFFSAFYHACDMGGWSRYRYCIMPYHVLFFCDFFCSIMSFWATLVAVAELPQPFYSLSHMVAAFALAMAVEWHTTGLWHNVVPIALGVLVVLISWTVRCRRRKTCYPDKRQWLCLIPGVALAGFGMCLFAFIETDKNYPYTHSAWHFCMSVAIVFLLPKRKAKQSCSDICNSESSSFELDDGHFTTDTLSLVQAEQINSRVISSNELDL